MSCYGQLAYGVVLLDDTPWECLEEWWLEETGFVPSSQPFTEDGEYAEGFSENDPRVEEHWREQRNHLNANPLPIEELDIGGDMVMLAVPGTITSCTTPAWYLTSRGT